VRSALGYNKVRVVSVGAGAKTLAQVRPLIEAELRARAGEDALAAVVASIEDGVEAGKSFADLASELKLTIAAQSTCTAERHRERYLMLDGVR
jgi:peptidyl-prolyl cis-trans isomerase D